MRRMALNVPLDSVSFAVRRTTDAGFCQKSELIVDKRALRLDFRRGNSEEGIQFRDLKDLKITRIDVAEEERNFRLVRLCLKRDERAERGTRHEFHVTKANDEPIGGGARGKRADNLVAPLLNRHFVA